MPRDDRTYITVHDGMPDHPKIEGLSDAAFRWLFRAMLTSSDGVIHPGSIPTRVRNSLIGAGLLTTDGALTIYADLFKGPFAVSSGRPAIPVAVRRAVMERDGFACVQCGSTERLSLDHIVRFRDGGPDAEENLRVLCLPCNWRRH